jgi:putative glutamine amidotransferase
VSAPRIGVSAPRIGVSAPRIGIAPALDERGRIRAGRRHQWLETSYADAIGSAGGVALYLALRDDPEPLLEAIDGLLIPGGGDFAPPVPYRESVAFDLVPPRQLAFDRALVAGALARGVPLLGVCYGMQLLALETGGRLHHHLPLDLPRAQPHQLADPEARHALVLEEGSRLAAILGRAADPVNSSHHQAVAEPGVGFAVSARAEDGVVEAIEREAGPFCVGVQWHPERLATESSRRLFAAFVEACRS